MKIMNRSWIVLTALCLLLAGCITPREYLESGDYKMAYKRALQKLSEGENTADNTLVLCDALDKLIVYHQDAANNFIATGDLRKKEKAIASYGKIIALIDESAAFTTGKFETLKQESNRQAGEVKSDLFQAYFDRGESHWQKFEQHKLKAHAQNAYYAFLAADKFAPASEDLNPLISQAKAEGVIYVGYTISPPSGTMMFSNEISRIFDRLQRNNNLFQVWSEHTNFVPDYCDCRIDFDFGWLDVDEDSDTKEEDYEEEIEVDDEKVEVYATVYSRIQEREISLDMRMDVNGNQNCNLVNEHFRKSIKEVAEKRWYEGDKRALPAFYSDKDETLKDEDDVVEKLMHQFFEAVCNYID